MGSNLTISRRKFISNASLVVPMLALAPETTLASMLSPDKNFRRGMLVGVDADKLYAVKDKGAFMVLDYAGKHGFDGVFYRTMLDLSPTLDAGELKEIKAHADSLGLYLDSGAGWVNPYNTAETPHIRRFGNGDYKLAMEMMIKAASEIDCKELYAVSGHSIHGDETSFELLQLIDELGEDTVGVTLDTGNLPLSGDVPMDAIRRLAPYIHMTHCKDGILYITEDGIVQQLRSVGEGIVDWEKALVILGEHSPNLHLSFEDYRAENL